MELTPEQIADGWIAHDGRGCPINFDDLTCIMLRDGMSTYTPCRSGSLRWDHQSPSSPYDIIAYKLE